MQTLGISIAKSRARRGPRDTADAIARAIRDGQYPANQLLPSYAKLAALHGVGIQTIRTSMDLLEKEGFVYREQRRGVFARGLPKRPQRATTQLRSVTIVATGGSAQNAFPASDHLVGHSNALDRHDLRMRFIGYWDVERQFEAELLERSRIEEDGWIVYGNPNPALLRILSRHGAPYVVQCFARYSREGMPEHPSTFVNKYKGACEATEYLLDLGHRRIGFLGHLLKPGESGPSKRVYDGYCAGLHRAGLESRSDDVAHAASQDPMAAFGPAKSLLERGSRPTALLCGNDAAAMGAVKAALALGIRVPEELSVVGFDNVPWMDRADIPLTTVSIPRRLLAEGAVELLLDVVSGKAAPAETRILECDLVVRNTTAAAPPNSE